MLAPRFAAPPRSFLPVAVLLFVVMAAAGVSGTPSGHRTTVALPFRLIDTSPSGNFVSACPFSHRLPDDPIVKPLLPGASHSHDFFANNTTNAFSTYASLRAGTTTCAAKADTAGYWVPTLYYDGVAVTTPYAAQIYYMVAGRNPATIRPFPAGLEMVAGTATATGPIPKNGANWGCGGGSPIPFSLTAPTCPAPYTLELGIRFPDCWDGVHLDSLDHKSHMAYSMMYGGVCPADHPVPVPALLLGIKYPVSDGSRVTLSSGPSYTAHGDFFNAWDQRVLDALVAGCLNTGTTCGRARTVDGGATMTNSGFVVPPA